MSVLLINILAAGLFGLKKIEQTQADLVNYAVPTLWRVEAVEEHLGIIKVAAHDLNFVAQKSHASQMFDDAERAIEAINQYSTDDMAIVSLLDDLEGSLKILREVTTDKFDNRSQLEDVFSAQKDQVDTLSEMIVNMTASVGNSLEYLLLSGEQPADLSELAVGVSGLTATTQIDFFIDRHLSLVDSLTTAQSQAQITEISERIAFNFRSIIQTLISLPATSMRKDFSVQLSQVRALHMGDDSLVAHHLRRVMLQNQLDTEISTVSRLVESISSRVNIGITQARTGIGTSTRAIADTIDETKTQLIILSAAIVFVIVLVAVYFIDRQVIQRLKKLSTSVREIADGNDLWDIDVSGDDEFGEMAKALEVFKQNSSDLRRSNEELARFAYAASHDLKSPLRAIRDLAQWTLDDAGDVLPEDSYENMQTLIARTQRLNALLDDLLNYARIGNEESSTGIIVLEEATHELFELLGASTEFSLEVTGTTGPILTPIAPFKQIVLNLMSNAMKHHDKTTGKIRVDFGYLNERLVVSVSDDGPGIDPKFQDRVFGLFQTLQSRDSVEGSGMGLSIVKKQVESFGGRIKLVSDPALARGTTFIFDWPVENLATDTKLAA